MTTTNLYIVDTEVSPDNTIIYIVTKPKYGSLVLEDDQQKGTSIS